MASRATIIISGAASRAKAALWVAKAPLGVIITFKRSKRTTPQNDRMWALLTAVSDQLVWHGAKYPPDAWKDYFMHSLQGARFMPHEEGGMVPIGRSTSALTKDEHSDLTMLIEAFAARQGVDLSEDREAA